MTAPLGSTGKITLDSLLKDAGDSLKHDADGNYSFSYADEMIYDVEVGEIPAVTNLVPAISAQTVSLFGAINSSLPEIRQTNNLTIPDAITALGGSVTELTLSYISEVEMPAQAFSVSQDLAITLPAELASIGTIEFGDAVNTNGSPLGVTVNFGSLTAITKNRAVTFDLKLPAGVTLVYVKPEVGQTTTRVSDRLCRRFGTPPNVSPTPNCIKITDAVMSYTENVVLKRTNL